jgi:uncharacterized protein
MNKVIHFEIAVDDVEAAHKFYGDAFGWQIHTSEMPGGGSYTSALTTAVDEKQNPLEAGAINGALVPRDDKLKTPLVTVGVDSIDEAISRVEAAGGKVVAGKQTIPGMGEYAYVSDPSGNVVGLWRDLTGA